MNKMYVLVVSLSLTLVATAQNLPDAPGTQKSTLTGVATDPVWPRYDRQSGSRSQNSGDGRPPSGNLARGPPGEPLLCSFSRKRMHRLRSARNTLTHYADPSIFFGNVTGETRTHMRDLLPRPRILQNCRSSRNGRLLA
jgi:hypothetical protein